MSVLSRLRPRTVDLLWLAALALAVLLIYGSSLGYPFFWVDPIDIGLAASRDIPTVLTNSHGYLYYRPFAFLLWKALHAVSGRFDPFIFHLVQVATHILNAWLFYALARRIFSSRPDGSARPVRSALPGFAALCFAWYPASYQTVTWVIAPQAQATAFGLAAIIAYHDARTMRDRRRLWMSAGLLAIALPFHENAVSFGLVIAALEAYWAIHRTTQQPTVKPANSLSRWPLIHITLCLAFAALWLLIPKDPDSAVARFEPASGWYLLQGLIWPVAGSVGPWRAWLDGPAWQPLILVAPPTILFLIVVYRYAQRLSLLAFGLVWFAVMVLPIWATRNISYVGVSPRIFYVAAPGAILIWVGLLTVSLKSHVANRVWRFAAGVLAVAILAQSLAFLAVRKELHDKSMPAVWDVARSGEQAGNDARLLYINVPDQITPHLREYPVGFWRAILMPVSVELGQYAELHTGQRPATQSLSVPALAGLENFPHQVDMRGLTVDRSALSAAIRAADAVYFTEYFPDGRVRVVEAGSVHSRASDIRLATFGERAELASADLQAQLDNLQVTLIWNCLREFDPQDTVFLHVFDAQGALAAQADGDPLRGLFPLAECRPGEQIRDVRSVALTTPERYTVRAGMYNRTSGKRLAARDANGQPIADDAVTLARFPR